MLVDITFSIRYTYICVIARYVWNIVNTRPSKAMVEGLTAETRNADESFFCMDDEQNLEDNGIMPRQKHSDCFTTAPPL